MNLSDIKSAVLAAWTPAGSSSIMDGEIPGTRVVRHVLEKDGTLTFPAEKGFIRIFFICSGLICFSCAENICLQQHDTYIANPQMPVNASTDVRAEMLEIRRYMNEAEYLRVCFHGSSLPFTAVFDQTPTYTEDCKSERTVSRMLVPARIVPRFAMGSVETGGDDQVAPHTHPMLEQFFFGLTGNDCDALIDDCVVPFRGNTLLHIPLGSMHGIRSTGRQVVRYIWMDFLMDEKGLAYMDSAHKLV